MSGIYIPGMEMPTSCDECPCFSEHDACDVTGSWKFADEFDKGKERLPDCPLVPVPEHGRLINADALDDILADQSEDAYNRTHAPRSWEKALSAMRDYLDGAPTIIPADKEGE